MKKAVAQAGKQQAVTFLPFYFISFLEGSAVMAGELIGAKMIGPFYGNSLYVWTSVLATTLGGLTVGYYTGGIISERHPLHKSLNTILLVSTILFAIMPWLSSFIMSATLNMSVQLGSLISCMIFIFPLLVCFGMVSPLIIRIISVKLGEVGKNAGTIYTVSTIGGIIMTFAMGFYLIPFLGLKLSSWLSSLLLLIATGTSLYVSPGTKEINASNN